MVGAVAAAAYRTNPWSSFMNSAHAASPDLLAKYKKIFASTVEEDVVCWYFGTMFLQLPGRPEVPVLQAETIMVYRPVIVGNVHQIRWSEVGYFRDPVTGLPAQNWLNPVTGKVLPTPRTFKDGPGLYTIAEKDERLQINLDQTGATVESVTLDMAVEGDRVVLQQTENKLRALPGKGTPGERQKATTILTLWADRAAVEGTSRTNVEASGSYSFASQGLPAWTGLSGHQGTTIVRGIMRKAASNEQTNRSAWEFLEKSYPDFFSSGRAAPRWSELFKD
jgi:hypothetical protein